MALRNRPKHNECKLMIDSTKPISLVLNDLNVERMALLKTSKKSNLLKFNNYKSNAATPQIHDILEKLIVKKTRKLHFSEKSHISARPKTVFNLKKVPINGENGDKSNVVDALPRYLTITEQQEPEFIGDYELGSELGKGSYGTVRVGIHSVTNEKVAIKSYEKSSLLHPNRRKAVEREIKILQKLQHPNIIKLLNTLETSSSIHLIFEYISGCSLLEYLKSRSSRKLEESQAKNIFKQILLALEFCHSLGITHRDIKLENVLLQDNHCVKIIDFGLSTYLSTDKKIQLFCGTMSYMAPEIVMGKETSGPPTDIWAATVLLYVMLSGTFPFKGLDSKDLCSRIQRKVYVMPLGISFSAREVIKNVFDVDLAKRLTAAQLLESNWLLNGLHFNSKTMTSINHYC